MRWVVPIFLIAALVSCTQLSDSGVSANESDVVNAEVTQCRNPRPMVCTMEYRPVCATLSGGGMATYPSGCNACADVAVERWTDGPCEEI
jgi:hypothetical protein